MTEIDLDIVFEAWSPLRHEKRLQFQLLFFKFSPRTDQRPASHPCCRLLHWHKSAQMAPSHLVVYTALFLWDN